MTDYVVVPYTEVRSVPSTELDRKCKFISNSQVFYRPTISGKHPVCRVQNIFIRPRSVTAETKIVLLPSWCSHWRLPGIHRRSLGLSRIFDLDEDELHCHIHQRSEERLLFLQNLRSLALLFHTQGSSLWNLTAQLVLSSVVRALWMHSDIRALASRRDLLGHGNSLTLVSKMPKLASHLPSISIISLALLYVSHRLTSGIYFWKCFHLYGPSSCLIADCWFAQLLNVRELIRGHSLLFIIYALVNKENLVWCHRARQVARSKAETIILITISIMYATDSLKFGSFSYLYVGPMMQT